MEPVQCGLTTGGTTKGGFPLRRHARPAFFLQRGDKICGNPCPICQDTNIIHYQNVKLLQQFISPYTGFCMTQHGQECVRNRKNYSIRRLVLQETMGCYPSRFLKWTSQGRTIPTPMTRWARPLLPPP